MDLNSNVVLAGVTQRARRQTNFALVHNNASSRSGFSDVAVADRTEQLAFVTSLGGDGQDQFSQCSCASFGSGQNGSFLTLELSTTNFEVGQVLDRSRQRLALRDQEVATVARLHVNLGAESAEAFDFF